MSVYTTPVNIMARACLFAKAKHGGQMYGDKPYMKHLTDVANLCEAYAPKGIDDSLAYMVGILHDVLEDTDATTTQVEYNFGMDVFRAVYCLTKLKGESYEDYIAGVKSNPLALYVKRWDTFCNLQESLKQGDVKRVNKYAKQLTLLTEEKTC